MVTQDVRAFFSPQPSFSAFCKFAQEVEEVVEGKMQFIFREKNEGQEDRMIQVVK